MDRPLPESIDLDGIAIHLAGLRRWRGIGVSVAQHSVLMARATSSVEVAQWALLHDAAEHAISDVPAPLHHSPGFARFRAVEQRIEEAIVLRFGLTVTRDIRRKVKRLDLAAGRLECEEYVPHAAKSAYPYVRPLAGTFVPAWSPARSRTEFLAEAKRLGLK